jgi:osmotically inducible protein OsmC
MKFTRHATAQWKGTGKEGQGHITTESGILNDTPYDFKKRFEGEKGTNPEELIGAAHAGCFTMQLSFLLNESGYTADHLETKADVTFSDGEISKIALHLKGKVPKIGADEFKTIAEKAKNVCPVSKLVKAEVTLNSTFEN